LPDALIRYRLTEGGAFHVNLVDANVLLHGTPPGVIYFDSLTVRLQRKSVVEVSPHTPLPDKNKI
jgi:hypothetical protein